MDDLNGEEEVKNLEESEDDEEDPAWVDVDVEKIKGGNRSPETAKKPT